MAPRKILALLVVVAVLLVSGSSLAAADHDPELGGTVAARGVTSRYLGDAYVGCLEMGIARCYADPTLVCSLQTAAAVPAGTGAAAPGADQAGLVFGRAIVGVIARGVITIGAEYLSCVGVDLARKCFADPTTGCVEEAFQGAC